MKEKIMTMLSSRRFWYAVIFAVAMFLEKAEIVPDAVGIATRWFSAIGIIVISAEKYQK